MTIEHDAFTKQPSARKAKPAPEFTQFSTRYDPETSAIWCWMQPEPRPCMNTNLLDELIQLQHKLTSTYKNQHPNTIWPFHHFILASKTPGVYNLGGDLNLITQCIKEKNEYKLREYANKAIALLQQNINNLDLPITMISLVQGQALGSGFEAALSCDVIIAERGSQLGFPEILFNMFPGMGAYNLLTRRIGSALAERIILSGRTYSAEKLYEMGVIDVLTENGNGVQAVEKYLNSHNQSHNTIRSIKKIRQIVHPISEQTLLDIVEIWLESALNLSEKDLARMTRLLALQKNMKDSQMIKEQDKTLTPRRGDWRKIKNISFPLTTHLGENVIYNRRSNESRRQNQEQVS